MRQKERKLAVRKLDREMRYFRRAAREKAPTAGLLRAVRQALRIPAREIAAKAGMNRSVVFDMERREMKGTIHLLSLARVAEAMGCKVVYGVVPAGGKTLESVAEERLWRNVFGLEQRNG